MVSKDDGIFIPKRLVFIMIFVSLCVNVFFLLMGILIGKEDAKYDMTQGPSSLPTEQITADEVNADPLDVELSMFDEKAELERRRPVDENILDTSTTSKPATKTVVKDPEPKPEPPPKKTEVVKKETKPKATNRPPQRKPTPPAASGSYWIQVLAISDKAKAEAFRAKIIAQGYTARIFSEGGFHKVRVGPYEQRAVADRHKNQVNKQFSVKGWVVTK